MAKPEEFFIRIEPDGRIILQADGLEESSYQRIKEFLEETVGPAEEIELGRDDAPPSTRIHPTESEHIEQKKRG